MESFDLERFERELSIFLELRRYDSAEKIIRSSLSKHHRSSELFNWLGVILSLQNRYFESIKALEYALELDPNFLEARVNLSVVLADLGYYHEAKSTFEEFLDDLSYSEEKLKSFLLKETKIDKDYLSLAKKFFDQKNYSFAQEELLKCLKVNPKNSDARELLAHIHYERQDYPRAEKDLDILLTEYPTNTKLLRLKALCALKQKNKDKLEQITKELRLKAPTDQSTHIFIEACRSLDMNL